MVSSEQEDDFTEEAEVQDLEALKQAFGEEKAKAEVNLAGWQRAQADLINYKRRAEQEKEETVRFANSALLLSLLPVLDDFERALAFIPGNPAEVYWLEGVRLIERKLRSVLEKQGLLEIKALGEPFDPRFHEAVRQSEGEDGIIVEEVQKGYKFHDRVLRPSRVVVGNGEQGDTETAAGEESQA